jgi:hypothetical protein
VDEATNLCVQECVRSKNRKKIMGGLRLNFYVVLGVRGEFGELLVLVLRLLAWLVNEKWEKTANKTARPEWCFFFFRFLYHRSLFCLVM